MILFAAAESQEWYCIVRFSPESGNSNDGALGTQVNAAFWLCQQIPNTLNVIKVLKLDIGRSSMLRTQTQDLHDGIVQTRGAPQHRIRYEVLLRKHTPPSIYHDMAKQS